MKALTLHSKVPHLVGKPIKIASEKALISWAISSSVSQTVWHHRFGHRNLQSMLKMEKDRLVNGLIIAGSKNSSAHCEVCVNGKIT